VVRHDVQEHAQTLTPAGFERSGPRGLPAKVLPHTAWVGHVVTVAAAGNRLQAGRDVDVADPQPREIGSARRELPKAKLRGQLDAVGGMQRRLLPLGHLPLRVHGGLGLSGRRRDAL
jgi:hypothetical protein